MRPDTKAIRLRTRAGVPALRDEVDALCDRVEALQLSLRDLAAKARAGHDSQDPELCNLCRALKFVDMELEGK